MDLPSRDRDVEPVEDCERTIDAYAGAFAVILRPGYSRSHFPRQRVQTGVRGGERGRQNIIRLATSVRNIATQQAGLSNAEPGV